LAYAKQLAESERPAGFQTQSERRTREQRLRADLIALRDEMRQENPTVVENRELLNDAIIDLFIRRKPRTRNEWFREIPLHLRQAVEPSLVAGYLDRILGVISSSS
jgi:hypothetical protein